MRYEIGGEFYTLFHVEIEWRRYSANAVDNIVAGCMFYNLE